MIFDSHAHYDDEAFDEDREALLDSMESLGVGYIVNVGASMEGCRETLGLIKRFPFVYGTLGFHPTEVSKLDENHLYWLSQNINTPKIVAVGEIGLDYYWCKSESEKENQKQWFEKQLDLARENELPVSIHSREAAEDTLRIVKENNVGEMGGVIHCFSYSVEMAKEYLDMGLYLGIGGTLTFKNARKIKDVVAYMPIEQMVIETDAPYLSPEPLRGKRNSSLNLTYVVNEIASIKNMAPREVIEITKKNAMKLYQINC